jgi:hypothetical protein
MVTRDCRDCNPLIIGWCDYVENTKGKMLDEKCPKVANFVNSVMYQTKLRVNWQIPEEVRNMKW